MGRLKIRWENYASQNGWILQRFISTLTVIWWRTWCSQPLIRSWSIQNERCWLARWEKFRRNTRGPDSRVAVTSVTWMLRKKQQQNNKNNWCSESRVSHITLNITLFFTQWKNSNFKSNTRAIS